MIARCGPDDLQFMIDVLRGHAEAGDCDHSRELADHILAELLALRKVADASSDYLDAERCGMLVKKRQAHGEMVDALKELDRSEPW